MSSPAQIFAGALTVLVGVLAGCTSAPPPVHTGEFASAAVAADHPMASAAGARILALGGNAVDAAVATSFTLSVVRPYSCGIGGGGFMLIHLPADPAHGPVGVALDYRETAPGAVGPDYYEDPIRSSTEGAQAVAVPGTVAGLLHALDRYGTLDRDVVLAPAIEAADRGFTVDRDYLDTAHDVIAWYEKVPSRKIRFPFVWRHYLHEGEMAEGAVIANPAQAEALRLIAEHGGDAFYRGPIADAIRRAIRRDGGVLRHADLDRYEVRQRTPIEFEFHGLTFLSMPPPSSGGIAMGQALGILDRILEAQAPDAAAEASAPSHALTESLRRSPMYAHLLAEPLKHAFADRARWLGDPDLADVPTHLLLSPAYLDELASRFDFSRVLTHEEYGTSEPPPNDAGTSHLSVVDPWGGAVACTETINLAFGSKLAVDEYGFCLNNEMDDFTTAPGGSNAFGLIQSSRNLPGPGKRPLSSMSPTIVLDAEGSVSLIAGASGGPRIISATLQVLLNVFGFGLPAGDAVVAPRLHHQWSPDVLYMERPLLEEMRSRRVRVNDVTVTCLELLQRLGHTVEPTDSIGVVQLIRRSPSGAWEAACDPRKGGRPDGF